MTIKITISLDGSCLDERTMQQMSKVRSDCVILKHRDVAGAVTKREMYPLHIRGVAMYADYATGTLYDAMTGRCLSSSQMWIVVATANPVAATNPKRARKVAAASTAAGWTNHKREVAA